MGGRRRTPPTPTTPLWLRAGWAPSLPNDAALLGAEFSAADIAASVREALACYDGYLRDAALLVSDWGFALSDVRCRTQLWYGAHDDRNPPATGTWWADQIEGTPIHRHPYD